MPDCILECLGIRHKQPVSLQPLAHGVSSLLPGGAQVTPGRVVVHTYAAAGVAESGKLNASIAQIMCAVVSCRDQCGKPWRYRT